MNRTALIFSTVWTPTYSPGARRMAAFAKFLVDSGFVVHVITSASQDSLYGSGTPSDLGGQVTLHLVDDPLPKTIIRSSLKGRGRLRKILAKFQGRLGIDKDFPLGCRMLVRYWSLRKGIRPDLVVGSFPNIVNVLVAGVVARLSGARLLADFRDAWTCDADYRNNLFSAFSKSVERRLVKRADLLTFVSRGVFQELLGHEKREDEAILLRNGADQVRLRPYKPPGERIFGYFGALLGANRNCRPLFEALALANSSISEPVFLDIFTGDDASEIRKIASDHKCDQFVRIHAQVDFAEFSGISSRWISGVVITRDDPRANGELTTKLFDYISVGLAVMAIAPQGFEIREIVNSLPFSATFAPDEVKEIATYLRRAQGNRLTAADVLPFTRKRAIANALGGRLF